MASKLNKLMFAALAASALTPLSAYAQEDTPAAPEASEERRFGPVIVTAQRREQNLLDVPLSVSAFSGDLLADLGIQTMDEVAKISRCCSTERGEGRIGRAHHVQIYVLGRAGPLDAKLDGESTLQRDSVAELEDDASQETVEYDQLAAA